MLLAKLTDFIFQRINRVRTLSSISCFKAHTHERFKAVFDGANFIAHRFKNFGCDHSPSAGLSVAVHDLALIQIGQRRGARFNRIDLVN